MSGKKTPWKQFVKENNLTPEEEELAHAYLIALRIQKHLGLFNEMRVALKYIFK